MRQHNLWSGVCLAMSLVLPVACSAVWAMEAPAPPAAGAPMLGSFAFLIEPIKPSVVNISTTRLGSAANMQQLPQRPQFPPGSAFHDFFQFFNLPSPQQLSHLTALGSGFIIDSPGYIVTNNHVIRNGTNIAVTLQDGTTLEAKLMCHDKLTDLTLLKVNPDRPLPHVEWGDSGKAKVGDWVFCVGNPLGLGGTVTAGILSARSRNIRQVSYDDFLKIDAPINQGNSGGPVFDEAGNVVGITTAILSPGGGGSVGIDFAIPSDLAKPVVGPELESLDIARQQGFDSPHKLHGAVVTAVVPGRPAGPSGIQAGDVIVGMNHAPVAKPKELTEAIRAAEKKGRKAVALNVNRGGQEQFLRMVLPPEQPS